MTAKRVVVTGGSGFIGIHLVELLCQQGYAVLNLDIKQPLDGKNLHLWTNVSLLEKDSLNVYIDAFSPNYIVHLAATTTQNAKSLDEFQVNLKGTQNLIEIANSLTNLEKFVFTSTQYVNSPGHQYSEIQSELKPYGFYGESKLLGEEMTKELLNSSNWTVIRPTTIWGSWHPVLVDGLWMQIARGRYLHPKGDNAIKAYGYVKNTAWQIARLLEIEKCHTDRKVFYLADENIHQEKWVNAFVTRLTGKKMRKIPRIVLYIVGEIGELLNKLDVNFPLYRSRYFNLITSNPSPLEASLDLLGPSPISFEIAVEETCSWLEQMYGRTRKLD